jgi:hypothetical protein
LLRGSRKAFKRAFEIAGYTHGKYRWEDTEEMWTRQVLAYYQQEHNY